MTKPVPNQRDHDLALLAAGSETGWWDDNGVPAPWPDDFFDDHSGWRTGEVRQHINLTPDDGKPPF
jgi:hypothetical protein